MGGWARIFLCGAVISSLVSCAETDNTAGSHLAQPEVDANGNPIIEAGDIAIAGQMFSHSVMALPEVASADKPPLVQFPGVTSIVNGPVDTQPYTSLLRDRLLLLTREKLRFVERQLPPLTPHHRKKEALPLDVDTDADYQVLAELRGNYGDDHYHVQIQFVDVHSNQVLFNGVYRITREAEEAPAPEPAVSAQQGPLESTAPNPVAPNAPSPTSNLQ